MSLNLYDWLKEVTYVKTPWDKFSEEDKATFNIFMLHRVIGMYEPYIDLANYIQKYWFMTPEQVYKVYCEYLPKTKIYAPYIKSTKPKQNPELLTILAEHYRVSTREIKQYLHLLKPEEVKEVLRSRGIDEDEINKMLGIEKSTKKSKVSK